MRIHIKVKIVNDERLFFEDRSTDTFERNVTFAFEIFRHQF